MPYPPAPLASAFRPIPRLPRIALLQAAALAATLLTGCALHTTAPPAPLSIPTLSGAVHGGNQVVSGSVIQLYAAGTTGYASAATPLLPVDTPITTGPAGNFTITGDYLCPSPTSQVYLTATGGNPGLAAGTDNTALALMTALGNCGNLTAGTHIIVNEVTTIAAVWALQQFMSGYANVGSSSTNAAGLANAFTDVASIAGVACGCALQFSAAPQIPSFNLPQSTIDTLANILASCLNSTGSTTTGQPCATLFADATPSTGTAPADTIAAALDIAHNPGNNVATIFALGAATAPFQPTLSASPNDWTMTSSFYGEVGEGVEGSATDAKGNLCIITIAETGFYGGCGISVNTMNQSIPTSFAFDASDNVWFDTGDILMENSTAIGTNSAYSGGLAFDSNGYLWVGQNSDVNIVSPSGAVLFTSPTGSLGFPDASGGLWGISAAGLVRSSYTGSAVVTTTYPGATSTNPKDLAIDGSGNIWVLNGDSTLSKFTVSGSTLSSTVTASGGGLSTATGGKMAIDGLGNVWVANRTSNGISEFSNDGTALSSASGWNPYVSNNVAAYFVNPIQDPLAFAIGPSGDITVFSVVSPFFDYGPNPFIETTMIGVAAPVIDSPIWAATNNKLGTRP